MSKKEVVKNIIEVTSKTAVSMIPVGGPLINETYDAIKNNALAKRRQEWERAVEEKIANLEISIEELGSNDVFSTTLIYATEQAMKTSSELKRKSLANAVYNSAVIDIDESIVLIYLDMIYRYSELHIRILSYFNNPKKYGIYEDTYRNRMGSAKIPLFDTFPELKEKEDVVDKIIKDLFNDGVMSSDNLNVSGTSSGMVASRTTLLGKKFVEFISE